MCSGLMLSLPKRGVAQATLGSLARASAACFSLAGSLRCLSRDRGPRGEAGSKRLEPSLVHCAWKLGLNNFLPTKGFSELDHGKQTRRF